MEIVKRRVTPATVTCVKKARPQNRRSSYHLAQEARATTQRAEAIRLRTREALTFREIGKRLGVSYVQAYRYVNDALGEVRTRDTQMTLKLRQTEVERTEAMLEKVMGILMNDNLRIGATRTNKKTGEVTTISVERYQAIIRSAEVAVKLSARLADLQGLDAPKESKAQVTHSGQVPVVTEEQLTSLRDARRRILVAEAERMKLVQGER